MYSRSCKHQYRTYILKELSEDLIAERIAASQPRGGGEYESLNKSLSILSQSGSPPGTVDQAVCQVVRGTLSVCRVKVQCIAMSRVHYYNVSNGIISFKVAISYLCFVVPQLDLVPRKT